MLEIGGITNAVPVCTPCSVGTYASESGVEDCQACGLNTYANVTGLSECLPCADSEYSYAGAVNCIPRLPCTTNDYEAYYTPCVSPGVRTLEYRWIEPLICDNTSVPLPTTQPNQPCALCNPGTIRNTNDFTCTPCPDGQWSSLGATSCGVCPPVSEDV
jgi:hypothetical protein